MILDSSPWSSRRRGGPGRVGRGSVGAVAGAALCCRWDAALGSALLLRLEGWRRAGMWGAGRSSGRVVRDGGKRQFAALGPVTFWGVAFRAHGATGYALAPWHGTSDSTGSNSRSWRRERAGDRRRRAPSNDERRAGPRRRKADGGGPSLFRPARI